MPKVTFRNILDEPSEFKEIDMEYLIPAVYEYARTCGNDELYSAIMKEKVVLYVDSECIKVDDWTTYKLNADSEVVISPEIVGGENAGWIQMALGAIIMVISIWVPALFPIGLALFLGGVSSLLFQPDLPNLDFRSSGKSQTYSWSGIKTMAQEDIPIPIVYGTHKVGGNLISAFTERYGEDDYLYMLIALAEGEIDGICKQDNYASVCHTSEPGALYRFPAIELDDQPLSDYSYVNWWYRKGVNATKVSDGDARITRKVYDPTLQLKIPGFDGAKAQFDDGREITSAGIVYTTTKEVDKVIMQVRIPALYDATSTTGLLEKSVVYRAKFRKEGTVTWYDYYPMYWTPSVWYGVRSDGAVIKTPGNHVTLGFSDTELAYSYINPDIWTIKITSISPNTGLFFQEGDGTDKYFLITVRLTNATTRETFSTQATFWINREVWTTEEPNGVNWDGVPQFITVIHYGPTYFHYPTILVGPYLVTLKEFIAEGNTYSIIATSGYSTVLDMTTTAKTKTGLWSAIMIDFNNHDNAVGKDVYEIMVYRPYGDKSTNMQIEDSMTLYSVVEIVQGEFIYPNVALLGIRIKATGQLSGSPPNITTVIRGKKIKVPDIEATSPSGTNVLFDSCFWNNTLSKWESAAGTTVYWNNTSSWRTEYSNNAMLCVRDLVLAKRYGLGEYINENDLYTTGVSNIIKLCHTSYEPTEGDHLKWWDGNNPSVFSSKIHATASTGVTVTTNNTARTLFLSGSYTYWFWVSLDSPLIMGQTYTISISLSSSRAINLIASVWMSSVYSPTGVGIWDLAGSEITNVGTGTHTISFIAQKPGYISVGFTIYANLGASYSTTLTITDISVNKSGYEKMHYHTWDGVLDNAQSALAALLEMCDSFRVWPVWYEGKFNFIMNKDETPVQTLSRGNTTEFTQNFSSLSDIPYKLIGQYTDEDNRWEMKSLIAKATDTTLTKINEKSIGLKGITNRRKAERELKFKLNLLTNCTHFISTKAGLDSVHFTAGDVFYVQDDLPEWGQGGRVLDYSATSLDSNIIGWWKFNEGAGTTFADSSGNGNTGDLYNTEAGDWVAGVQGTGFYFNLGEASEYGQVSETGSTLDQIQTFSCWVHPIAGRSHATTYHILVSKHSGTGYGLYIDYVSSPNKFWVWYEDSTGATSGSSYTILDYNKWYHLAGVFTSNRTALLYVNGVAQTEGNVIADRLGSGITMSGQPIRFGGGVASRYALAKIDEVVVFNKELTAAEIMTLYKYPPKGLYISTEDVMSFSDRTATNIIRYQTSDNSYVTATVNSATVPTTTDTHYLKLLGYPQSKKPVVDSVFAFGKSGSFSKKFRALSTVRNKSDEIEINAIEHLSDLYTSEPTIRIIEDNVSQLPNPFARPDPPTDVFVSIASIYEGVGFRIGGRMPDNSSGVTEIRVEIKQLTESDGAYALIGTLAANKTSLLYINNNLTFDIYYSFRFTACTPFKSSLPKVLVAGLYGFSYALPPPSGGRIQGVDPNTAIFYGKDVTVEWNPIDVAPTLLRGYVVEVYHGAEMSNRLLRTINTSTAFCRYTYENMLEDSRGAIYGTFPEMFIFKIFSVNIRGYYSLPSPRIIAYNGVPGAVTGLTAIPDVGAVAFDWTRSTEPDHKSYQYCTKVGTGAWNTATKISDNHLTKKNTAADILNYGNKATIYIRVKDVDWYKQVSATYAITSASANLLSDNLFQLFINKSSGAAGYNASLQDGVVSGGGITIA